MTSVNQQPPKPDDDHSGLLRFLRQVSPAALIAATAFATMAYFKISSSTDHQSEDIRRLSDSIESLKTRITEDGNRRTDLLQRISERVTVLETRADMQEGGRNQQQG